MRRLIRRLKVLFPDRDSRARRLLVSKFWGGEAHNWERRQALGWTDHPRVKQRIYEKTTGSPSSEPCEYFTDQCLSAGPNMRALSLACGRGHLERTLAERNLFKKIDAIDISEEAIALARSQAAESAYGNIEYSTADLNRISLPRNTYDIVYAVSAVHHIAELESLFKNIYRSLKPGGVLYMDEYIGPSQFQWPDNQTTAINQILDEIPENLRISGSNGQIRMNARPPTVEEMNAYDPSEAIRSAEIIPLVHQYFPDPVYRGYGGTLLQWVLAEIAGNFAVGDPVADSWLTRIFQFEDEIIESGALSDDFAVVLARKPAI